MSNATAAATVTAPNADDVVAAPAVEVKEITVSGVMTDVATNVTFTKIDPSLSKEERIEKIHELLTKTVNAEGQLQMIQAEMLLEVQNNGYWKNWKNSEGVPFAKFDEYVEKELGLKKRTMYSRMATYKAFVLEGELGRDDLQDVNWSIVGLVTPHVTKINAKQLLEACKGLTFRQGEEFRDALKASTSVEEAIQKINTPKIAAPVTADVEAAPASGTATAPAADAKADVKTLKVVMAAGQYQNVTDAIAAAKAAYGTDSDASALDIIASEWLAQSPPANMSDEDKVAAAIRIAQMLETNLGVKLEVLGVVAASSEAAPIL